MDRFIERLTAFAITIGGPGLFVIAALDSSFLSLPQINDFLVIWMVIQHKERMVYYVLMATLGSLTGCLILYHLARQGGEAFLRRRVHARRLERGLALFNRYGMVAIMVPAVLPPPAPFKLFVLLAGVARVPVWQFTAAVAVARGARYFTAGVLAVWYGDDAVQFLAENGWAVLRVLAVALLAGGIAYILLKRHRAAEAPESPEP